MASSHMSPLRGLTHRPVSKPSRVRSLVLGAVLLIARVAHGQHASTCGDRDKRETLRAHLAELMLSNESRTAITRREQRLPLVHPDSIVYVDDERICERAARVYYRYRLGPRPLGAVSVARVGDMWVVFGELHIGEWTGLDVYNRDFELVGSFGL